MIKIRVMGKDEDLDWVLKLLEAHADVEVKSRYVKWNNTVPPEVY